jgi:hypothetical protein
MALQNKEVLMSNTAAEIVAVADPHIHYYLENRLKDAN